MNRITPEFQNQLFLCLPVPMLVVSHELEIVIVNFALQEFLLTSHFKLQTRTLANVFGEQHKLVNIARTALQDNSTVREGHVEFLTSFGQSTIADVQVSVFEEVGKNYCAIIVQPHGVIKTIDYNTQAHTSAQNLSGIASILAHEIKNPLAGIRGAAQLLAIKSSVSDNALTQLIIDETDRILRLLTHVEQFGAGSVDDKNFFNIHEVLHHVQKLAQASFAQNIEFILQYDPSLPEIFGSKDQITQVILNLVKNAAEALIEKSYAAKITLTTAFKPGLWLQQTASDHKIHLPLEICVQDNGSGIPAHIFKHVFEPFHTNKQEGRGLGLALVAKIIKEHGGMIDVISVPQNTQFRILLPITGS